ncbi:hypothetical protein [Sulfurifustis variabilis]|nr:hypothetical protein [Sulfurifustis variabilis]
MKVENPLTDEPFETAYYDFAGFEVRIRYADPFESSDGKMPNEVKSLSLPGWLLRGAIREDDVLNPTNGQPLDDPYNTGSKLADNRVLNHFYDPAHDWPLNVGAVLGKKAPDWAVGAKDIFSQPHTPEPGRRNHFTVFDAREAMYRALTGRDREGQAIAKTQEERNKYWATTFRALGDIVHLIQDMAQPQHTRNDPHAGIGGPIGEAVSGHKSVFEAYIETRALAAIYGTPKGQSFTATPLDYIGTGLDAPDGYPVPRFTDYISFFTTRHKDSDIHKRQGLADYSNRGFFSAGRNLDASDSALYDYPSNNHPSYPRRTLTVNWEGRPLDDESNAKVELLLGSVADSFYSGGSRSCVSASDPGCIALTTYGVWDQFLEEKTWPSRYTLNRYNYDDQASLLIPRAVAYSAGLIDYFFRGRLEPEDVSFTSDGLRLRIRNTIDLDRYPEWENEVLRARDSQDRPGVLVLVYEYTDTTGTRRFGEPAQVDMVAGDDVRPDRVSRASYLFPIAIPADAREVKYRIVFRGRLGSEDDAIAVGTMQPVTGFLVTPNYLPTDEVPGRRMVQRLGDAWRVSEEIGLEAGTVDWKGWYVDGKPTKVLSWVGPSSRYFPDVDDFWSKTYSSEFSPQIFRAGRIHAVAPKAVLGAAVYSDAEGKDWIVAVTQDGHADVVYRRPNRSSNSDALQSEDVPAGWEEIGRLDNNAEGTRITLPADVPWFFNGPGTEAQTMRKWWDTSDPMSIHLKRLKLVIQDGRAVFEDLGNLPGFSGQTQCTQSYDEFGAGSARQIAHSAGQYILAVDYKDEREVFAILRLDSESETETQVTVIHDHEPDRHGSDQESGGTTRLSNHRETLVLDGGQEIPVLTTGGHLVTTWSPDTFSAISSATYDHKEITYYLDLRYDTYAYTYWGVDTTTERNSAGGMVTEVHKDGIQILSSAEPIIDVLGPRSNLATYPAGPNDLWKLHCSASVTDYAGVGELNFGWRVNALGSWAVDAEGNLAVSQRFYDGNYYLLAPHNLITGGRLESLLPDAPAGASFKPVGVLH